MSLWRSARRFGCVHSKSRRFLKLFVGIHFHLSILGFGWTQSRVWSQMPEPVTAAAFSPQGDKVLFGSQFGLQVWSWPDLQSLRKLNTDLRNIHDLRFSPDGHSLLVAGGSPAHEGVVEVWAWPARARTHRISDHNDLVYRVAWSESGEFWASAGADGNCLVHDARNHEKTVSFLGHSRAVVDVVFLFRTDLIVSAGVDHTLRCWKLGSGVEVRTLDNHLSGVNAVAQQLPSRDDSPRMVATVGEDKTVRFWQPTIGRLLKFARLSTVPRAAVWATAGDRLFVGCNDGSVYAIEPHSAAVMSHWQTEIGRVFELLTVPGDPDALLVCGAAGFLKLSLE
jgi:WD40 repeat protein